MSVRNYQLEIGNQVYCGSGDQWSRTADLNMSREQASLCVVTDFATTPALRTVRGDRQFAEAVLGKELRDTGEILGASHIITHHKRALSNQNSAIFYTGLSAEDFEKKRVATAAANGAHLLICLHTLLYRVLETLNSRHVAAVLIAHGRHLDFVVGGKKQILGAGRLVTQGATRDTIIAEPDLAQIRQRLQAIERTNDCKIQLLICYNWLTPVGQLRGWPEELGELMGIETAEQKKIPVILDGDGFESSLAPILNLLRVKDAVSSPAQRVLFGANHLLPLMAAMVVLCNVAAAAYLVNERQDSQQLSQKIAELRDELAVNIPRQGSITVPYSERLRMVLELEAAGRIPSFRRIFGDITQAMPKGVGIEFDQLLLDYPKLSTANVNDPVKLEVRGIITEGLSEGMDLFNGFVEVLKNRGYRVSESQFNTDISVLRFHLRMEL